MGVPSTLRIGTLNVAGLVSPQSQDKFLVLQQKQLDILAIQEAHCPTNLINSWSSFFYPKISYWKHYTAFIINPNINHSNFRSYLGDRVMAIDIVFDSNTITVINVYAPNTYTDRKQFFQLLSKIPFKNPTIFLGDFNQITNPSWDHFPVTKEHDLAWDDFINLQLTFSLVDLVKPESFDIRNMTRIGYRNNRLFTASRIDLILISSEIQYLATQPTLIDTHISDHKLLQTSLKSAKVENVPKWSKLMPFSAKDPRLSSKFKKLCIAIQEKPDIMEAWEKFKVSIIKMSAHYNSRFHHKTNAKIKRLINHLNHLESNKPLTESEKWDLDWYNTKAAIKKLQITEDKIKFLMAGAKWTAHGERPGRFFTNKYKARTQATQMESILYKNISSKDPNTMSEAVHNFYSSLYKSESNKIITPKDIDFLLPPQLSQEEFQQLIKPITMEEITETINQLPNRKSPGPDGLPYELYKQYKEHLILSLTTLFNRSLQTSEPIPGSGLSFMITLFKKGDREDLKNWRPIALTNTDSKIYSKIIAKRIGCIATRLITPQQYGFVPQRFIWDNINTVNCIISNKSSTGALVFLDQEKAYDRVDWSYLVSVLEACNFPEQIITWLKLYLKSTQIKVRSGTFITDSIVPTRGLRQGDPISPILYNFAIDPFLRTLNQGLTGITIHGLGATKVLAFADDCVVMLKNYSDTKFLESTITKFGQLAQSKVNINKTEIIRLGNNNIKMPWKTRVSKDPVRHLGVLFTNMGMETSIMENAMLMKAQERIANWNPRSISLIGRTYLINTFITSITYFLAHSFPFSSKFITKFNNMTQRFIWNTNYPPTTIKKCQYPKEFGGIGLINIRQQAHTLFGKCLIKMIEASHTEISWYRAMHINFAKALNLPSPLLKLTLTNYLTKHNGATGPIALNSYWKAILALFKHQGWTFEYTQNLSHRGFNSKTLKIKIKGIVNNLSTYPVQQDYPTVNPEIYIRLKPNNFRVDCPKKIWEYCFDRAIPVKWQANTWKFLTTAYRDPETNSTLNMTCKRCKIPDRLSHWVKECPKATFIWKQVYFLFNAKPRSEIVQDIIPFQNISNSKLDHKHIVLTHLALWAIHTSSIEERNHNRVMALSEINSRIIKYAYDLFYSYQFIKTWPAKTREQIESWINEISKKNSKSMTVSLQNIPILTLPI